MKLNVVILAAGKGTRMYSPLPKVLHTLAGKSLIKHVIDTAAELEPASVHVVVGYGGDQVKEVLGDEPVTFTEQKEQKGTAHAVAQVMNKLDEDALALVLYGDVPLIRAESLRDLLTGLNRDSMGVLTCGVSDPTGLGRILRDPDGKMFAIAEEKDATDEQRKVREINTGIMAFPVSRLREWLPRIGSDNAQQEFYLTDIIPLAIESGCEVRTCACEDQLEASGVNNKLQLATLERHYQQDQANKLLLSGVGLADPARFDLRGIADVAPGAFIDVNVILEGKVIIEEGASIGANSILKNCMIKRNVMILPNTLIEDAVIGEGCSIGPFARIRPGTELERGVKIGNFVETKNARIAEGSKVNHLSYIGDSELGRAVNVGAGTITCNYDGANKHKTEIGDRVFIGSNSSLVAPVIVESGATIGAGSTITRNIGRDQLAVSRPKQNNIDGWVRPRKK